MRQQQVATIPASEPDDAELVRRASVHDEAAFRTIMQRNNRRLYRIARSILRSDSEAEDVVQETYVRAFTHLAAFRGESSLGTWLGRIALNEALGRQRRERPTVDWTTMEASTTDGKIIAFPQGVTMANPEHTMAQQEIMRLVEAAIDQLPKRYRLVLVTRVIEGLSVEETAKLLKLSIEAVKTQLHRARALLHERLEEQIGPMIPGAFPFGDQRCARLTETVLRRLNLPQ